MQSLETLCIMRVAFSLHDAGMNHLRSRATAAAEHLINQRLLVPTFKRELIEAMWKCWKSEQCWRYLISCRAEIEKYQYKLRSVLSQPLEDIEDPLELALVEERRAEISNILAKLRRWRVVFIRHYTKLARQGIRWHPSPKLRWKRERIAFESSSSDAL